MTFNQAHNSPNVSYPFEAEGVQASFDVNSAQPLSPGLFTRIAGIGCALSKEIYSSFEDRRHHPSMWWLLMWFGAVRLWA